MFQRTTRKGSKRLLAMAAGATLAAAASSAMATFQYDLRFADGSHNLTLSQSGGTAQVQLWAQITSADSTFLNDSPSTDTMSIKSSNTGAGAFTGGGVGNIFLSDYFFVDPPQTQDGKVQDLNGDGINDRGGSTSNPTVDYIRYLAAKQTVGGYRAMPPDSTTGGRGGDPNHVSDSPPAPGLSQAVNANTWEWKIADFTINIGNLTAGGTTTFLPVSAQFTGQNSSYDLSYFNDSASLQSSSSGASVIKDTQLAPKGVTFTVGTVTTGPQLTDAGSHDGSTFGAPKTASPPNSVDVKVDPTLGDQTAPLPLGTELKILNSSNTTATITVKFRHRTTAETPPNSGLPNDPRSLGLISDVADVSGFADGTDKYVIWMTYDPASMVLKGLTEAAVAAAGDIHIDSQDGNGNWVNTVKLDHSGTPAFVGVRAYDAATDGLNVGEWGVDIANHAAWAIVDHASTFAVVPEPAALGLLGLASLGLLARKRNRKA